MSAASPESKLAVNCCARCATAITSVDRSIACPGCGQALWCDQQAAGLHVFGKDIAERFLGVVAQHLDVPREKITLASRFDDLGADSLDVAEITIEAETAFDITFPADDAESVQTVGAAIRAIELCLAGKKQ